MSKIMDLLKKVWNNFRSQPDIWFFYAFLITFSLSIRKVLFSYPIQGQFNEYSGAYLYLGDIFMVLTFISWIIPRLCHKRGFMSIANATNVPRGTFLLPLFLVIWSFVSLVWSSNIEITLFRSIKLLEFYLFFLYTAIRIVPRGTILKKSFEIVISIGVIQSIIGIFQFASQHSVGLFWLKESLLKPDMLGVAKIVLHGEKFIRSYGLFPHPNILGGFLLFSILITYTYTKVFHVEQFDTKNNSQGSTPALHRRAIISASRGKWNIHRLILFIQSIALFLTSSKSAIIGLFIGMAYIFKQVYVPRGTKMIKLRCIIQKTLSIVPRGTILSKKVILVLLIAITSFLLAKPDLYSLFIKSLNERMIYLDVSRGTIMSNPIFGLGMGQFVVEMQSYAKKHLSAWEFQPVHNVFLLIWSELGLIGISIFIAFLWNNLKNNLRPKIRGNSIDIATFARGILLGLLFIMIFDHYLWDIQQGEMLLWMTLALSFHKK